MLLVLKGFMIQKSKIKKHQQQQQPNKHGTHLLFIERERCIIFLIFNKRKRKQKTKTKTSYFFINTRRITIKKLVSFIDLNLKKATLT